MQHYYRVKRANGHVATLHTYCDWDKVVADYGDDLIGEVNGRGVFQRFNIPSTIRNRINDLLLSMNENNILEVHQKITELHDSVVKVAMRKPEETALPDYRFNRYTMGQLYQGYYNQVIIPSMFPEEKCKVCESPMFERIFPYLFFKLDDLKKQVLPTIVKTVDGKEVVDTDALNDRSRRIKQHLTLDEGIEAAKDHPDGIAFISPHHQLHKKTPEEVGISVRFKAPTMEDFYLASAKTQEVVDKIGTNIFGEDWHKLKTTPVIPPLSKKTAYELWLEEGNVGEIEDYVTECTRKLRTTAIYPEDFKETVRYLRKPGGHTVIIRKDNYGGYSLMVIPAKPELPFELPDIKGVALKGSKIPVEVADQEINSKIIEFVEANFPEHVQKEVLAKVVPDYVKPESNELDDIVPTHLKRILDNLKFSKGHAEAALISFKELISGSKPEATELEQGAVADAACMMADMASTQVHTDEDPIEILKREETRRLLLDTNVHGIQDQFLKFLERCDEELLNTATPTSFDREHFEKVYQANRDQIGVQLGAVLAPHIETQGYRAVFMVDAAENNVVRIHRKTRDGYRLLVTIRFNKGFFNIEMH